MSFRRFKRFDSGSKLVIASPSSAIVAASTAASSPRTATRARLSFAFGSGSA